RPVALKFLPTEFALHPSRLKRFIQEARAASALNHPNIITVYEIGRVSEEENAAPYFATELIEGVTLKEHMLSSRMKLGEVVDIACQIASALVAAHAAGIVHRDIKLENIMVRHDGYIKVLDFGLAKPTERQSSLIDSEAQTRAFVTTDPGTVMGTVSYMSPEQARRSELDARTDIWSLGVLFYELITGHLPFTGATPSHVIVALLENEPPPLATYVADAPEALELIVEEALRKDRDERTQTAKQMLGNLRRLKQRVDSGSLRC
ncbi:MAG: serine/threonine-protein kinase, partial [Pyrinomonadaceae bacterium]